MQNIAGRKISSGSMRALKEMGYVLGWLIYTFIFDHSLYSYSAYDIIYNVSGRNVY